ncbi:MAG: hypothetical protein WD230_01315 [Cucumibacter sp.]
MRNSDDDISGYAGLYADMQVRQCWIATRAVGVGAYERGDGKDLGRTGQFHLGLDVA